MRKGDRPAGAILGFANFLLRFYQAEQPRAVLVGWDTLDAPTYRNERFPHSALVNNATRRAFNNQVP